MTDSERRDFDIIRRLEELITAAVSGRIRGFVVVGLLNDDARVLVDGVVDPADRLAMMGALRTAEAPGSSPAVVSVDGLFGLDEPTPKPG